MVGTLVVCSLARPSSLSEGPGGAQEREKANAKHIGIYWKREVGVRPVKYGIGHLCLASLPHYNDDGGGEPTYQM